MLFYAAPEVSALEQSSRTRTFGLKIAPLEYRTNLKSGENQKGFVDVSNPTNETLSVTTSVQAFRQTDDSGRLEFVDSEQVAAGIQLDLDSFELPPKSALRMYFLLKSDRLPTGDVFASIFFTTRQAVTNTFAINSAVRVGTLLSIINKTPGAREAEITQLDVPLVQWGSVSGAYRIKNTARMGTATGFYPEVELSLQPFGSSTTKTASLLFAGRERRNNFTLNGFGGLSRVTVGYSDSQRSAWVISFTPWFIAATVLATMLLAIITTVAVRRLRRPRQRRRARRKH